MAGLNNAGGYRFRQIMTTRWWSGWAARVRPPNGFTIWGRRTRFCLYGGKEGTAQRGKRQSTYYSFAFGERPKRRVFGRDFFPAEGRKRERRLPRRLSVALFEACNFGVRFHKRIGEYVGYKERSTLMRGQARDTFRGT
jgi:hypothetical protein